MKSFKRSIFPSITWSCANFQVSFPAILLFQKAKSIFASSSTLLAFSIKAFSSLERIGLHNIQMHHTRATRSSEASKTTASTCFANCFKTLSDAMYGHPENVEGRPSSAANPQSKITTYTCRLRAIIMFTIRTSLFPTFFACAALSMSTNWPSDLCKSFSCRFVLVNGIPTGCRHNIPPNWNDNMGIPSTDVSILRNA